MMEDFERTSINSYDKKKQNYFIDETLCESLKEEFYVHNNWKVHEELSDGQPKNKYFPLCPLADVSWSVKGDPPK